MQQVVKMSEILPRSMHTLGKKIFAINLDVN